MRKEKDLSLEEIVKKWGNFNVPDIQVISFDYEKDKYHGPWQFKNKPHYVPENTNPKMHTVYLLLITLKDKPEEFRIIFKLYAIIRGMYHQYQFQDKFRALYKQFGEDQLDWWPSNARHVLPHPIECRYVEEFKNFSELIEYAAKFWTALSQEYVILKTPDLMDNNSQEYKDFEQRYYLDQEQREFEQYKRLSKKFGIIHG